MPKSRNRGGAKVHRRRVVNRSKNLTNQQKAFQNIIQKQIEEFKKMNENISGQTENQ
jgi:hypothetical protein